MLSTAALEHILATIPRLRIGVLGDLFLDRYLDIDGALTEPSLETGLDAYQVVRVRSYPGAAGTVLNNLAALGVGTIVPIAVIGDDGEGYELRQALAALPPVRPDHLLSSPERRTPTYTKPMLLSQGAAPRELNRLDIKNRTPLGGDAENAVLAALDTAWPELDALVVVDQVSEPECGVVTRRVRERLAHLGASQPSKLILADSRERIGAFRNVAVKPNAAECARGLGRDAPAGDLGAAATALARRIGGTVFCTSGPDGIWVAVAGQEPKLVPGLRVAGPVDTVGAGDSTSAGLACALAAGAPAEDAAAFANLVASITIRQIGVTGTASPEQVRARHSFALSSRKLL
jgi:bifunctional ADP-heptose synthase (sugar kinase/adenylyltransferase)